MYEEFDRFYDSPTPVHDLFFFSVLCSIYLFSHGKFRWKKKSYPNSPLSLVSVHIVGCWLVYLYDWISLFCFSLSTNNNYGTHNNIIIITEMTRFVWQSDYGVHENYNNNTVYTTRNMCVQRPWDDKRSHTSSIHDFQNDDIDAAKTIFL